jgi:hypothetical protein
VQRSKRQPRRVHPREGSIATVGESIAESVQAGRRHKTAKRTRGSQRGADSVGKRGGGLSVGGGGTGQAASAEDGER